VTIARTITHKAEAVKGSAKRMAASPAVGACGAKAGATQATGNIKQARAEIKDAFGY
jgi:hypothetical protein